MRTPRRLVAGILVACVAATAHARPACPALALAEAQLPDLARSACQRGRGAVQATCRSVDVSARLPDNMSGAALNVALIVIDGVSGVGIERALPKLSAALHRFANGSAAAQSFAFPLHTTVSPVTEENHAAYLSGRTHASLEYSSEWLWEEYAKRGFITFVAQDACAKAYEEAHACRNAAGRHVPCSVAAAAARASSGAPHVAPDACADDRYPIGGDGQLQCDAAAPQLHACPLEALVRFVRGNSGAPKFAVAVLTGARGGAWTSSSLDGDLARAVYSLARDTPDLLLAVAFTGSSESGRFPKDASAQPRVALGHLSLVVSTALLERHEAWAHALHWNQGELNTPHDVHFTLRDALASAALRSPLAPAQAEEALAPRARSLLHPLATGRTCADADVPRVMCPCARWAQRDPADRAPLRRVTREATLRACMGRLAQLAGDGSVGTCAAPQLLRVASVWEQGVYVRMLLDLAEQDSSGATPRFACVAKVLPAPPPLNKDPAAASASVEQVTRVSSLAADQRACDPAADDADERFCVCARDRRALSERVAARSPYETQRARRLAPARAATAAASSPAATTLVELAAVAAHSDDGVTEALAAESRRRGARAPQAPGGHPVPVSSMAQMQAALDAIEPPPPAPGLRQVRGGRGGSGRSRRARVAPVAPTSASALDRLTQSADAMAVAHAMGAPLVSDEDLAAAEMLTRRAEARGVAAASGQGAPAATEDGGLLAWLGLAATSRADALKAANGQDA